MLIIRLIFLLSAAILVAAFAAAYINFGNITHLLIVHFDAYRGIDFLGAKGDVFGVIFTAFIIAAINFWLAEMMGRREKFFAYLFAAGSLFLAVLILAGVIAIINVN